MSSWAFLIPQSALVSAWPFDNTYTTSSLATDPIGGNNATLTSVLLNGSGPNALLNNSGSFNGSSSFAQTTLANLNGTAFTVLMWMKAATWTGGNRFIANDHTDADLNGFQGRVQTAGTFPALEIGNGTTSVLAPSNGSQSQPANVWNMYTWTYAGTTLTAYKDTASLQTQTITGPITSGTNNIAFGYNPAYSGDFTAMNLAGVAIYSRAISGAEVTSIFNTTMDTSQPAILGLASAEW